MKGLFKGEKQMNPICHQLHGPSYSNRPQPKHHKPAATSLPPAEAELLVPGGCAPAPILWPRPPPLPPKVWRQPSASVPAARATGAAAAAPGRGGATVAAPASGAGRLLYGVRQSQLPPSVCVVCVLPSSRDFLCNYSSVPPRPRGARSTGWRREEDAAEDALAAAAGVESSGPKRVCNLSSSSFSGRALTALAWRRGIKLSLSRAFCIGAGGRFSFPIRRPTSRRVSGLASRSTGDWKAIAAASAVASIPRLLGGGGWRQKQRPRCCPATLTRQNAPSHTPPPQPHN